jgi:hypothetical protein
MQGTVVMLLALSGLGCHHKSVAPAYAAGCYSSCYSDFGCYSTCYSGGCYSSCYSGCYSSCYSGCYSSCYSGCYSCYSGCYSAPRHRHGLFGCKRNSCAACCATAYEPYCGPGWSDIPVYGTYTPVYEGYGMPPAQAMPPGTPMPPAAKPETPATGTPMTPETTTPAAPSPGNPAPVTPPTPVPPPAGTTTTTPPTPVPGF